MANTRGQLAESAEYDAGLMLYQIAGLSTWSVEGVSYSTLWGKGKTPTGIKEIRAAASTDISRMFNIVAQHSDPDQKRSKKTEAFYQLVRNVYLYRNEGSTAKGLIEEFCLKQLNPAERGTLPGAAKQGAHSVGSFLRSII